jgi:hypothetical protein
MENDRLSQILTIGQ